MEKDVDRDPIGIPVLRLDGDPTFDNRLRAAGGVQRQAAVGIKTGCG